MRSAPRPRSSRCVSLEVLRPVSGGFLVGCLDGVLIFLWWLLQVDSARKRGVLLEAVQVLADLDLSINKAYISSDGRWFMDVFHVTDRLGRKLTDDSVITYIQQVGGTFSLSWLRRSGKGAAFLIRFAAVYRDLERTVEAGGARGVNGA